MSNLHLDDKLIWTLHLQKIPQQKIADQLGCSKKTIGNHINKMKKMLEQYGDPFYIEQKQNKRDCGSIKHIPFEKILELYEQGLTLQEISDQLGCTRSNINIRLNRAGIYRGRSKINNIPLRNKISESLKGRFMGEDSACYKGYVDEKRIARGLFKTLAHEIIRNSNFHCSICQKKAQTYHVHHIKPFSIIFFDFIKEHYSGNIETFPQELINNCPEFWDKNNLIMVCKDCHYKIHYTDNPELNPYRWKSATTIEKFNNEFSRVDSSESKHENT